MRWITAALMFTVVAPLAGQRKAPAAPKTGQAVLKRMHDRYAKTWYRTLTFKQTTGHPGQPDETWYEAASIPGKLRIDIAPVDSGNAFMYVGDSTYGFAHGVAGPTRKDRNLLLTLGFDVYRQPVETTVAQLQAEGLDMSRVRGDTWKGSPVWVVGAQAGDTTSAQFWIEPERMLFVRLIQRLPNRRNPSAPGPLLDTEFNDYQRLEGGWIAVSVVTQVNGKLYQTESYSEVRGNVALDPALWNPRTYTAPAWLK